MNTSTLELLDGIAAELIRRGLPADYAERAALELAEHHRDLVDELRNAGWTDTHAVLEARAGWVNAGRSLREPSESISADSGAAAGRSSHFLSLRYPQC
jgi:hypothetical protein